MTNSHGGKRQGAGRKKLFDGPKTTVACPKELAPKIRSMITEILEVKNLSAQLNYLGTVAENPIKLHRPLSLSNVPAGFPSPADDYIDTQLDLNEFFVKHPSASFYWKVSGESMNLAGILDGAILLVDRSLEAMHNDIVLATINGDVTVKRFVQTGNIYELRPDSSCSDYHTLKFKRTDDIAIWGVVSAVFNKFR